MDGKTIKLQIVSALNVHLICLSETVLQKLRQESHNFELLNVHHAFLGERFYDLYICTIQRKYIFALEMFK